MSTDPVAVYYCFCEYFKNIVCVFPLCVVKTRPNNLWSFNISAQVCQPKKEIIQLF